jgi:hypothetical protein
MHKEFEGLTPKHHGQPERATTLQHLRGVSNVLEQRFLRGERVNNIRVHRSKKR